MLVTMGMTGALVEPSSHFDLSGVFDKPTWNYAKFTVYFTEAAMIGPFCCGEK